ncbi:ribonuclease H-like protein [Ascodesmis nigricans]|uniref:ribonuclease H n=1 Tax=Ascodesmis nigricans TaxID=341454 RepID=A0A4S2N0P7_9PEZI|nr:ribonuclease H-like protein [Ascodesmis nigricans]
MENYGDTIVQAHKTLKTLYSRHQTIVGTTWHSIPEDIRSAIIDELHTVSEQAFWRAMDTPGRQYAYKGNLSDIAAEFTPAWCKEDPAQILNVLSFRIQGDPLSQFPFDAEFVRAGLEDGVLPNNEPKPMSFRQFLDLDEYGISMDVTSSAPPELLLEVLRKGKGLIQREHAGWLILCRQHITYIFLTAFIEANHEIHTLSARVQENNPRGNKSSPTLMSQPIPRPPNRRFLPEYIPPSKHTEPVKATRFIPYPPHATPFDLFEVQYNTPSTFDPAEVRFFRKCNPTKMLMFVDGACPDNQTQSISRGGSGVVYTCLSKGSPLKSPLPDDGNPHTSNRAELRAVILGLKLKDWAYEGVRTIILACDSEYVVKGMTEWMAGWVRRGWRTSAGKVVKNKDLWEELVSAVTDLKEEHTDVQFWQIPRALNEADQFAKEAALSSS